MIEIIVLARFESEEYLDRYEIEVGYTDDVTFARAEKVARAHTGSVIEWHRSADGLTAYWGPHGASFYPVLWGEV